MRRSWFALVLCLASGVIASIHELIIGSYSTAFLYTVEFDDEALTLTLVANTSVPYASNWIAFNVSPLYYLATLKQTSNRLDYSSSMINQIYMPQHSVQQAGHGFHNL